MKRKECIKNIIESNYSYIKLTSTFINEKNQQKTNYFINEHFILSHKSVGGTQGYYIEPIVASFFIKYSNKWHNPVDGFMDSYWIHKIPTITYTPSLIADNLDCNLSTIGIRKNKIPYKYKVTREFTNFCRSIRKFLTYVIQLNNTIKKSKKITNFEKNY